MQLQPEHAALEASNSCCFELCVIKVPPIIMNFPRWLTSIGMTLAVLSVDAHPIEHWMPRNGQSYSQNLNGIAYGNGTFVAVGSGLTPVSASNGIVIRSTNGFVVTSTNGIDWEAKPLPTRQHLNGITYAKGRFVAVGNSGTIVWSEDGNSWSNVSLPISHNITAIGYGSPTNSPDGLFVATATLQQFGTFPNKTIALVSSDGRAWQTNSLSSSPFDAGSDAAISSITFGHGRFFAAWNYTGAAFGLISENGFNWSQTPVPTPRGITAFGNDQFIVITALLIGPPPSAFSLASSNALNWPGGGPSGSFRFPRGLCFAGGRFVAVGDAGYTGTSQDGTNWIAQELTNSTSFRAVTFGDGIYAAVGTGRQIFTSPDGTFWTQRSMSPTQHLLGVESDGDKCIAAGWGGTIAWSTGRFWGSLNSPTTNNLWAALNAKGHYIFAGDLGTILSGDHLSNLAIRTSGTVKTLNGIASDTVTHVIVGDTGTVLSSEDTVDWETQNSTVTARLAAVIHGNGAFVAVGDAGTIVTSGDGKQWTKRTSGTSRSFRDVAFGNGVFVAIAAFVSGGNANFMFTSTNGFDWVPVNNSQSGESKIAFGNGFFIYPTYDDLAQTRFNVSTDGRTWEQRVFSTPATYGPMVNDLTYHRGTFVSVANNGSVWQSDPVVKVTWDANSGSGNIVGPVDGAYRVQAGSDLRSPGGWTDLTNLTSFPYIFSDPEANRLPSRFYRALLVE